MAPKAWLLVAPALLSCPACDHFVVPDFAGAKVQLTIAGATPTPAGRHVEIWARDGNDRILRLLTGAAGDRCLIDPTCIDAHQYAAAFAAYVIAPAVDLADPCMIDDGGNLLWQASAQPGATDDERALQSQAVLQRIQQLSDGAATPLYGLVSWDDAAAQHPVRAPDAGACAKLKPTPCIPDDASGAQRLARCQTFFDASGHGYVGNPLQLTQPVHGQLFGMVDFATQTPAEMYGGIQVLSEFSLSDLRELWLTEPAAKVAALDPDEVDCGDQPDTCRGPVLLDGMAGTAQRGIYRFDLGSRRAGWSGTAAVLTRLDVDPVQF